MPLQRCSLAGLYLHIPFCKQACYYCDFHFSTNQDLRTEMVHAMLRELELQQQYLSGEALATIYLGGGTPSLLNDTELQLMLKGASQFFPVMADAEVTAEVNPDDLTPAKLNQLRHAGINRLSVGIQSFSNEALQFFNRAHTAEQSTTCMAEARKAGFNNISIDLIYGVPGQTHDQWRANIAKALLMEPEHISAYALTIEENTVFGRWHAKKKITAMPEELVAEQFEILMDELSKAGYEHYEISNFAKPGFYSKHNSSYWQQKKYLGIGPSAHSYNGTSRQFNIRNNALYIKSIHQGAVPFEREELTPANRINEYLLTTLRTQWGTDLNALATDLHFVPSKEQSSYIDSLVTRGLALLEGNCLRLTRKGKLVADKIASDLFVSDDYSQNG